MSTKLASMVANSAILILLLGAGIWLFTFREHKMAGIIAHELTIPAHPAKRRIVNDQYIILTKDQNLDLKAILDPLNLEVTMPLLNWTLVSKKGQQSYKELPLNSPEAEDDRLVLRSLLDNHAILFAEHNFVLEEALLPKNSHFSQEWQFNKASPENRGGMNMPEAWDITTGSSEVIIATIDDFLVNNHFSFGERFAPCATHVNFLSPFKNLINTSSMSSLPHGELMLLALGACADTKISSTGINWRTTLWAVQRSSRGHAQSFLSALYASGIDVCRESLLPCPKDFSYQAPQKIADVVLMPFSANASELLHFSTDMIKAMVENNVSVVTAAGNNNEIADIFFPGAAPMTINVGALNADGKRASFSNWGPGVDILAPGDNIRFYYANGPKTVQGTSIAAAYVAGTIGLMKAVNSNLRPIATKFLIKQSGRALSCDDYCEDSIFEQKPCPSICCKNSDSCGSRGLDAFRAVQLAIKPTLNMPLIMLDQHFALMFRAQIAPKRVVVSNLGDKEGEVRTVIYDDNLVVEPNEFWLSARGDANFKKEVLISYKREPFARHVSKVEFVTYYQGQAIDTTELYV
ncbi:MAG TPA: S8/S53 family peptidase, partial [Myxococcota bacterium]|nr:S8/S53 family peptidase [Myxococcota bacterium]